MVSVTLEDRTLGDASACSPEIRPGRHNGVDAEVRYRGEALPGPRAEQLVESDVRHSLQERAGELHLAPRNLLARPPTFPQNVDQFVDTMRAHPRCVGLAAPQIGEAVRVVAVDASAHPKADVAHGLLVFAVLALTLLHGWQRWSAAGH